jgi:taurine dioxygenase
LANTRSLGDPEAMSQAARGVEQRPYERIEVHPVAGSLGAEITGADPRDLDEASFGEVHRALLENEVIFFRRSKLEDDSQMALAHRFGQPSVFPLLKIMGATGPTFQVIEDGPDSPNAADYWHTDVTWTAEPPKVALLRAGVVAESGGDTMWGSMTTAYEALSLVMQELLSGLEVVHDCEGFIDAVRRKMGDDERTRKILSDLREAHPPVVHPLIRTHPETGRRAILFGGHFMQAVDGMTPPESDAILGFVKRHIDQPHFHCRWRWQPGDLAIWDERSTVHQVVNDHFPQRRSVHRCVVDGDRPYFDPAVRGAA